MERNAALGHQSSSIKDKSLNHLRSTSTQDSDPSAVSILPDELITEILLRLPVKSLMRFNCVSRSWLSLISSHQFIKSHFRLNTSTDNQRRLLILRCVFWNYYLKHCSLDSLLHGQVTDVVDIDYPPFEGPRNLFSVEGCCNGLICIAIRVNNLFLWNPSTRKSKKLPDFGISLQENNYYTAWGLGYDEINDDHKVVAVVCILDDHGEPSGTLVMVYGIKTGSWRRIGDFESGFPLEENGKFVNGKLHWLLDKEDCGCIGSLDLATEMYGVLDKPKYDEDSDSESDSEFESTLDVFQGCLCLLCDQNDDHIDVWVMKEYGVRESWTKVLSILVNEPSRSLFYQPLCVSEKGECLLLLGSKLVLYNPKDASYGDISFRDQQIRSYSAVVYTESLVSPLPLMMQQNGNSSK